MVEEVFEVEEVQTKMTERVLEILESDEERKEQPFKQKTIHTRDEKQVICIDSSPEKETGGEVEEIITFRKINVVDSESPNKRKNRVYRQSTTKNESDSDSESEKKKKDKRKKSSRLSRKKESPDDEERRLIEPPSPEEKLRSRQKSEISRDSVRKRRSSIEYGKENGQEQEDEEESELQKIHKGIKQIRNFFDDSMCHKIEKKIDQIAEKALCGLYKQKTYDRAPLRNKYFFGEGYTYGKQMEHKGPGQERLHVKGDVDEIPKWIQKHIVQKVYEEKLVPDGWINSAVVNEYFPGGCIVSHIDPIHIFDRPIISISFNSKSYLSFGVKFSFNPIRTSEPTLALPLDRGTLTMISGYAADNVTHCIRPQDVVERRCVIILRRVFPDAPRVGDPEPEYPLRMMHRSRALTSGGDFSSRKRQYGGNNRDYYQNNNNNKRRKTRHSY
ncbi:RNA demethylase ALKBH5-like [Clytia hemisphaerica]|uniref:RNA demethylase ALKBH5 n=1 Tax=Clytia hemisphaerica TaxID=252671 RepID=A0A7M5XIY2_9CNID|eukprot:TCONS_00027183-protein